MAAPPKPPLPPPGYFERKAALAASKLAAAAVSTSSYTLSLAPPMPPSISFANTISDVIPYIPITLDLNSHNYYH